jgi:transcriptional antiterminator NusG
MMEANELPQEEYGRLIWPRRTLTIRRKGVMKDTLAPIFPGYLFLETEQLHPDVYWTFKKIDGFFRFLKSNTEIEPLYGDDRELLLHFLSYGEIVSKSQVFFDENQRIRVLSGPLSGLAGKIVKVNKRKKRAKVKLQLYEDSFLIDFGLEILEPVHAGS